MPSWSIFDTALNPNYPGSSGYGASPVTGRYGPLYTKPPTTTGRQDYGVYDAATGKVISILTGKPFSGRDPHTGQMFANGSPAATPTDGVQVPFSNRTINPNDPTQRYQPVDIVKSPDIAAGEQALMKEFQDSAAKSLQDFNSYLTNFKTDLGNARTAGAAATNIAPTEAAMRANQAAYQQALQGDISQLRDVNAAGTAGERAIVQQATDVLPMYDAAAKAVADQQMAAIAGNLNRYKAGSATPRSIGSDEEAILAGEAAKVYAPMELAKIQQRQNLIQNLSLPVQRDITGRESAAITGFNAPSQGAIFQSGQALESQIQNLKQAVAGMSYAQAVQFMQAAGVPPQLMQQILSGQIGQLGALGQIEEQSRYRGLQDVLGANLSQPVGYNMGVPAYPTFPTRYSSPFVPGSNIVPASPPANPLGGIPYRPIPGAPGGPPAPPVYPTPGGAGGGPTYGYGPGLTDPSQRIPGTSYTSSGGYPSFMGPGAGYYNLLYGPGGSAPTGTYTGDVNIPNYFGA